MHYPLPKLKTLLWRGWRKKCPQCGEGALYRRWIKLHDRCPVCGLQYLADQGDLWGPLVFIDRVLFIIPLILLLYFRLTNPSRTGLFVAAGALIFTMVFTLPNRNGMSLAVDYLIRRKSGDLADQDSPEAK